MEVSGYLSFHVPGLSVVNFAYCERLPEDIANLWGYPEFEHKLTNHLKETICGKDLDLLEHLAIVDCRQAQIGTKIIKAEVQTNPMELKNAGTIVNIVPRHGIATITEAAGQTAMIISRVRPMVGIAHTPVCNSDLTKLFPQEVWEISGHNASSSQSAVFAHGPISSEYLIVSLAGIY